MTTTVFLLAMMLATSGRAAEEPSREPLRVQSHTLGVVGGSLSAATFVNELVENGSLPAEVDTAAGAWIDLAGRPAPQRRTVALVTCGLGGPRKLGKGQAWAYAFLFAGPDAHLVEALHIPYGMVWDGNALAWAWRPPVAELAALLSLSLQQKEAPARREANITVKSWPKANTPDTTSDGLPTGVSDEDLAEDLAAVEWGQARSILETMSWWAAWDNGLRPTRGDASLSIELHVRPSYRAFDLQLIFHSANKQRKLQKFGIPETSLQAALSRMVQLALAPDGMRDIGLLVKGEPTLLSADTEGVVFNARGALFRVDPSSGKVVYPQLDEVGDVPTSQRRKCVINSGVIYRTSNYVARVNIADGNEEKMAAIRIPAEWAFCVLPDNTVAVAKGGELHVQRGNDVLWKKAHGGLLTCGPIHAGNKLIVGDATGRLHAYGMADGKKIWERKLPQPVHSCLSVSDKAEHIYACDRDTLHTLDAATSEVVWTRPLGDTLLRSPVMTAGGLLVVDKRNIIRLLDPHDGSERQRRVWDTWLTTVESLNIGGRNFLSITDIASRVTCLSPETLAELGRIDIGRPLVPGLLAVENFPRRWAPRLTMSTGNKLLDEEGTREVATAPTIIVADQEGFIYLLQPPGEME
ncbi:MAG: PQQ-binding-like beta-propeller repeat protein [Planctomycetes bacterium]|nr:PQQ-binding-like beta-propeller repeat protein [Planctomycetota bacterium]